MPIAPASLRLVRTCSNPPADVAGVVFRHAWRAIYRNDTAAADLGRAIKPAPRVRPRTRFHKAPALCQRFVNRFANVLVRMFVHRGPVRQLTAGRVSHLGATPTSRKAILLAQFGESAGCSGCIDLAAYTGRL